MPRRQSTLKSGPLDPSGDFDPDDDLCIDPGLPSDDHVTHRASNGKREPVKQAGTKPRKRKLKGADHGQVD